MVTFVYAKCYYVERRELWRQLEECQASDLPWLVLGDFNVICTDAERIGGNPRALLSMREFNDCLHHCGLFDLPNTSQHLSWCNGHEGKSHSWAKLDCVLINNAFSNCYGSSQFKYLSWESLDHCPMVVYMEMYSSHGPSLFRFLNMWCLHDLFLSCVNDAWYRNDFATGLLRLAMWLKRTKVALRAWNKNVFGRVEENLQALEERLEFLEIQLQTGFSKEVETEYLATKLEIQVWENREVVRLEQIKKKWLIDGDQNTKFFESAINQRRNKGCIDKMVLTVDRTLDGVEVVHKKAIDYF